MGWTIGHNGAEMFQLMADSQRMRELARDIGQQRHAADHTIRDQLQMYESIEAEVQQYQLCLARLHAGWALYHRKWA